MVVFERFFNWVKGVFFSVAGYFLSYIRHSFVPGGIFTFLTKLVLVLTFGQEWLDDVAFFIFCFFIFFFSISKVQQVFYAYFGRCHEAFSASIYYQAFLLPGASLYSAILSFFSVRLVYGILLGLLVYIGYTWIAGLFSFYLRYIKAVFVYDSIPQGVRSSFVVFLEQFLSDQVQIPKDQEEREIFTYMNFFHPMDFALLNLFIVRRFHRSVPVFAPIDAQVRGSLRTAKRLVTYDYKQKDFKGMTALGAGVVATAYIYVEWEKISIEREKLKLQQQANAEKRRFNYLLKVRPALENMVKFHGGFFGDKELYRQALETLKNMDNEIAKQVQLPDSKTYKVGPEDSFKHKPNPLKEHSGRETSENGVKLKKGLSDNKHEELRKPAE